MTRRISTKLIMAAVLVSLVVIGLLAYSLISAHRRSTVTLLASQADAWTETIKRSTHDAMLENRREEVHRIIESVGRQQGVLRIRIFNKEGRIIYSPQTASIGSMVDKQTEACFGCHAADAPLERLDIPERTRFFTDADDRPNLGIISPIYNEESCWQAACHAHDAGQSVLGVLDVTLSLEDVSNQMRNDLVKALILTLAAIVAMGLILWLLFRQLVARPVLRLVAATEAIASGDLDHRIDIERDDELGRLEHSFNEMTGRLAETQSQLYQSNKMASVGRLAAGIAHEINNPLTGVLTFSSLLLKSAQDDEETREDLETIVRETKRCREIVRGLLDFSRQVPPRKTRVDLNEVVARALGIVDHQLEVASIRVTQTLASNLPPVKVDPNQIIQVLINLLVNAADAIGDGGGEIFVGTDSLERNGDRLVRVKVADSGCGIPRENLDKIFEPFFTTKDKGGTGLGLAVAWGIVSEHGGTIAAESRPERGTTFRIELPTDEPGSEGERLDGRSA